MNRHALALDIGGTFTDLQVLEESTGRCFALKRPPPPDDPSRGFMEAIEGARAELGFELSQVGAIFHGTTIATSNDLARALVLFSRRLQQRAVYCAAAHRVASLFEERRPLRILISI